MSAARSLVWAALAMGGVWVGCTAPERDFNRATSDVEAGTGREASADESGSSDDDESDDDSAEGGASDDDATRDADTEASEDDEAEPDFGEAGADDAADGDDAAETDDTAEQEDAAVGDPVEAGVEVDDPPSEDAGNPGEADADTEPPVVISDCQNDDDCSDGNLCNGTEACVEGECHSGERAEDGAECAVDGVDYAQLCMRGNCVASVCGDAIVDWRTDEQCDDGNPQDGDGCEVGCTLSCSSADDCGDGEMCNGAEVCGADHVCAAGEPMGDGDPCGDSNVCYQARCIPEGCGNSLVDAGEACDDGNLEDGDGCDADCTYTCMEDADCDDGDVCNGQEVCKEGNLCGPGEGLVCEDSDACTDNACDPQSGCFYPLIDADGDLQASTELGACGTDCDDTDSSVYSGAGEECDDKDNNCDGFVDETALIWYRDCDGDTFAPAGAPGIEGCSMPAQAPSGCDGGLVGAWTTRPPSLGTEDCYDSHAETHPMTAEQNELAWDGEAAPGRSTLVDYDFNCDTTEERRYTVTGAGGDCGLPTLDPAGLIAVPRFCLGSAGWSGASIPECGTSASYTYCSSSSGSCARVYESREQTCR